MKKINILTLVSMAAFSLSAFAVDLPDYKNETVSTKEKIADAMVYKSNSDHIASTAATSYLLVTPAGPDLTIQDKQTIADDVLADPTFGGTRSSQESALLVQQAIAFFVTQTTGYDAQLTLIDAEAALFPKLDLASAVIEQKNKCKWDQAALLRTHGDRTGAISLYTDIINTTSKRVDLPINKVAEIKIEVMAKDVMEWAKLRYFFTSFNQSQKGIDAVAGALRSCDLNLVRSNAFIQYQKDGSGPNILSPIKLPNGLTILVDDNVDALRRAFSKFSSAKSNDELNNAVSKIAQILRNIDGNLIRANDFVVAQTAGKPFEIVELK